MDWYQFLMFAFGIYMMHRDTSNKIDEFKSEFSKEMRDFHGRICSLEERYIQMMERFMQERK